MASQGETAKAEEIASKAILPPELRQPAAESADTEERALADAVLDQPGIDPGLAKIFRPLFHAAADADHANLADSERMVKASGGTKMLCPKCGGRKKTVFHGYNSNWNPYTAGTLPHALYENNRNSTSIVNCDECGGTGVVNAR